MARGIDWHRNIFTRTKRQEVCHTTSILQRSPLPFSFLKTVLCAEVAERFANPRARAQHELTDKINTEKERKGKEKQSRKQNLPVCRYNIQRQPFPTSQAFRLSIHHTKVFLPIQAILGSKTGFKTFPEVSSIGRALSPYNIATCKYWNFVIPDNKGKDLLTMKNCRRTVQDW